LNLSHVMHALFATVLVVWNGRGSRLIDARAAQRMQTGAEKVDETILWTVYGSPERFIARPCMTHGGITPMPVHLESPTLEGLRAQLPRGLTRTDRLPDDAPVLIETWE
jgi:hypothetical protein